MCSFKDELVFSVTSAFIQQPVIRNFFRDIVDMGIDVVLESNDFDAPYREMVSEKPESPVDRPAAAAENPVPAAEKTASPVDKPVPAAAEAADPAGKEAP